MTNRTDTAIAGPVCIYYKNSTADVYYGGITYRVTISQGLAAGETVTEVGAFLWDRLPAARGARELLDAVLAEYEVDAATAAADISAFLNKLHRLEIL